MCKNIMTHIKAISIIVHLNLRPVVNMHNNLEIEIEKTKQLELIFLIENIKLEQLKYLINDRNISISNVLKIVMHYLYGRFFFNRRYTHRIFSIFLNYEIDTVSAMHLFY